MSGTLGIVGLDTGRFTQFAVSMGGLDLPPKWGVLPALNYDCAHACNWLADNFTGDYLMLMGDDHGFAPRLIHNLLLHERPIVAPLCLQRRVPFAPVARKDGEPITLGDPMWLAEVDETGTAGMLIHRSAFEMLEPPYFWHGETDEGYLSDDIYFCRKARAAGFSIFVDTGVWLSHYAALEVAPHFDGEQWTTRLRVGNSEVLRFRPNEHPEVTLVPT